MDLQEGRERALACSIEVIIGCFCKIALLCNWAVSTNVVCVFIMHILFEIFFLQSRNVIFKCVHTYLFFCAGPQAGEC